MISEKIKEIRTSMGLSQIEFGHLLSTSSGHISDIENGKKVPGGDFLCRVCATLNVDGDWLLRDVLDSDHLGSKGRYRIAIMNKLAPICDLSRLHKGDEEVLSGAGYKDCLLALSETWTREVLKAHPADLHIVSVDEDSMEPTLRPGDLVLVHTSNCLPTREGVYVLDMEGVLLLRRVQFMSQCLRLFSDNPVYESCLIHREEMDMVHILGRVVCMFRPLV